MLDDEGLVGLGEEVARTAREGLDLGFVALLLGGDDDGDAREVRVGLHGLEDGVTVHDGHDDVQEHGRHAGRVVPQPLERLPPVGRLGDEVVVGEDAGQEPAVDGVVVDNENGAFHQCLLKGEFSAAARLFASSGLSTWASMPASRDACRSSANAFAVMATMRTVRASGWPPARMARVAA